MSVGRAVRDRIAAQSAMADVVEAQRQARPRGRLARAVGVSPLVPAARASYRDALAELVVGDILENLGNNWDVLHDLPLGDSTLDHLLIGPAGTFAIRAAHYGERDIVISPDGIAVGGEATDDVADAIDQSVASSEYLSAASQREITVEPLVVVVAPRRLVRGNGEGTIVTSYELSNHLSRLDPVMAGSEVAAISDFADLESTWGHQAAASKDIEDLHKSFAVVRDDVRSALLRRVILGSVAAIAGLVTLWVVVAQTTSMLLAS